MNHCSRQESADSHAAVAMRRSGVFRALLVELPKAKTAEDCEALLPWRLDTAER